MPRAATSRAPAAPATGTSAERSSYRADLPGALSALGWAVALAGMAFCPSGCSHRPHSGVPTAGARISITSDGSPLAAAVVEFCNEATGMGGGGTLDGRGTMTLDAVPLGDYTVTVVPSRADLSAGKPGTSQKSSRIPVRFQNPQTSPLSVTVKKGTNDFVLELNDAR